MLIGLAAAASVSVGTLNIVRAQNCEAMTGSAQTDCYIGSSRISGQRSRNAGDAARVRTDEEFLRAVTGTTPEPKPRSARLKHKKRAN